jgi:glucokinase
VKKLAVGIDIGGTFTKFGIVDCDGKFYAEGTTRTDAFPNVNDYVANICSEIETARNNIKDAHQIVGIGIGAPDANYIRGTVENPQNLSWKGIIPLAKLFGEIINVPIKLTNDANAAALGEMIFGNAKGMKDFLMITLGTGLGSGIVVNGELVLGHDGFAGELGHVCAIRGGRKCNCGKSGCLETYVSATGIKRTVFEILSKDPQNSELAKYSYDDLDSELIYEARKRDDPIAIQAFENTGRILGEKLADTVAYTNPEAIFLFGGLAKSGDYLLQPTKKHMEDNLMPVYKNKVKIMQSALMHKSAAILGAAALIWREI